MIRVLIADDHKNFRKFLATELAAKRYDCAQTDNGAEALDILEQRDVDVLLLDLNMPGLGGMDVLKRIKSLDIPTEVIILTGHATVPTAVQAMKLGAYDYLTKPFNIEELTAVLEKAYEKKQILHENRILKRRVNEQSSRHAIVTANPIMKQVLEAAKKMATTSLPVLITGESGVGKELIAREIHDASKKVAGPFLPVNCGAIPDTMLESELFGHEKGAFTGALEKKPGLLEIAEGGTLFLDEIGEMPQRLQVKLLRAIETGRFFRVGGVREIGVDVRFISATNKDLKKETETGNFRPDLYYRISALVINIPPLCERKEDIPLLIEHIIRSTPVFRKKKFSDQALRVLSAYSWPGNVRELQNVVQRVLLLSQSDVIEPYDLPLDLREGTEVGNRLEEIERVHILKVLKAAGGHRGKAAAVLGIDVKTLYRKLLSYGVTE